MEGYGILNTINGDKYEGEFKSNEKEGYGIIYSKKGNKYKCQFKNYNIFQFQENKLINKWKFTIIT